MKNIPFDSSDDRSNNWVKNLSVCSQENCMDNEADLTRLHRNLRKAREEELTPRQQEVLELYYDANLNISEIARQLQVNRSTVSRTLRRARERLQHCLRYSL